LPHEGVFGLPRRYIRRARLPNPRRILSYEFLLNCGREEIFESEMLEEVPEQGWLQVPERHFSTPQNTTELNRLLYLDVKMALADNDLRKVTGTAEMAGVRTRFPLLDQNLVEFAGCIPSRLS
jgi:asparagine synthase (glutamine-hydrolysing)